MFKKEHKLWQTRRGRENRTRLSRRSDNLYAKVPFMDVCAEYQITDKL